MRANAARVFEAMGHGALDAVDTPRARTPAICRAAPRRCWRRSTPSSRLDRRASGTASRGRHRPTRAARRAAIALIAIGASAGGPAALATVLRGLPKDFPAAIVIVQHVDEQFAAGMAEWLSQQSRAAACAVASEGDRPAVGDVLLAGTSDHLMLKTADRLGYTAEPRDYVYRPSVDVFFQSVCRLWRGDVVGVLLTGMGRDGALGLKALRDQGHHTIAQDEATSAVYGMPKAAATLDAAVDILPLDRIAAQTDGGARVPELTRADRDGRAGRIAPMTALADAEELRVDGAAGRRSGDDRRSGPPHARRTSRTSISTTAPIPPRRVAVARAHQADRDPAGSR